MSYKTRSLLEAAAVAAVATIIIRMIVFTEDCNLLMVAMIFLATFAFAMAILWIFRFFRTRT